jgi:hypothetical protein
MGVNVEVAKVPAIVEAFSIESLSFLGLKGKVDCKIFCSPFLWGKALLLLLGAQGKVNIFNVHLLTKKVLIVS